MNRVRPIAAWIALLAAAVAAGCRTPAPPPVARGVESDPCADRLHDLCGRLLLYYSAHAQLPEHLADLGGVGSDAAASLACPVSGKPYLYIPRGLPVPGWPGRLILHDAEPCHSGRRWGILAEPPRSREPLVVRVVRVPETAVRRQPPHDDAKPPV